MGHRLHIKSAAKKMSIRGFTLIEMAMVMVIVGIVISIMMTVLPTIMKTGKIKEAQAKLAKYDYALLGYAILNLRLPFADSDEDGLENPNVFVGDLPYRTLGLSNGNDVWGQAVKYAVYGAAGNPDSLTTVSADKATLQAKLTNIGAGFLPAIVYTTTPNPPNICTGAANALNSSNQAYVLASGGPKNVDGVNGYFDCHNGLAGAGFNAENKIMDSANYDDLVRSFSLNEFSTKVLTPY